MLALFVTGVCTSVFYGETADAWGWSATISTPAGRKFFAEALADGFDIPDEDEDAVKGRLAVNDPDDSLRSASRCSSATSA